VTAPTAAPRGQRGAAAPGLPAVRVHGLTKRFVLPQEHVTTVKELVTRPAADRPDRTLAALSDVSFDIRRGEFLGVLGKNGSGKSTLLRCLAGIYVPDGGTIAVDGRLVPFIELGVGFDPELSARDNAVQSAVLFGLERAEAVARLNEMLDFAELRPFAAQKLKSYSSGMAVRLAFAVAAHVDADILLCDEVLAVGDAGFKQRCFEHFERMRAEGRTVVLVTHDVRVVREHCDRALLLHRGQLVDVGDPDEIAEQYERVAAEPLSEPPEPIPPPPETRRRQGLAAALRVLAGLGSMFGPPSLLRPRTRRFAAVTRMLAVTDFKLKYADAALSYGWAFLRPAIFFGVLLAVFRGLGRFDEGVTHYPAYLVIGVVLWTFFLQSTTTSLYSFRQRAPLLRTLPFPRLAVPLATVLAASFDLFLNFVIVVVFFLIAGITPTASWLELPLIVGLIGLLATGVSLILSSLYVRYRDLDQLWNVAGQALFFLTPVFYTLTTIPASFRRTLVLVNPIATALTEARHALIDPKAPTAAALAGGWPYLVLPVVIAGGLVGFGSWVYRRESPKAPEFI
jgi:ABC-type polysaccharide/polyol phosphate transport system ATPase subunit/ABC-type polysaccharide/polyol phosphate export permease